MRWIKNLWRTNGGAGGGGHGNVVVMHDVRRFQWLTHDGDVMIWIFSREIHWCYCHLLLLRLRQALFASHYYYCCNCDSNVLL